MPTSETPSNTSAKIPDSEPQTAAAGERQGEQKRILQIREGRALENTYFVEIVKGLSRIQKSMHKLRAEPYQHLHIVDMQSAAQSVADLAMVHGYEGVESIARRMETALKALLRDKAEVEQSLFGMVERAVATIQRFANVEDKLESELTVEKVNEHLEHEPSAVEEQKELPIANPVSLSPSAGENERPIIEVDEPDNHFDIRESEIVVKVVNTPMQGATDRSQAKRVKLGNDNQ